ncbi:hypothetical protein ACH5RR_025558 [Cinchona calisaya]|uniref:Uncharacterized protein n=1 Tax=Cinchona calisaya TaxID=153742 RepID=A0ABD2YZZ7_9GENT
MVEELVDVFQKFDLSEKENGNIDLEMMDNSMSLEECKLSLVGIVKSDKVVNYTGVKNFATQDNNISKGLGGKNREIDEDRGKEGQAREWVKENCDMMTVETESISGQRTNSCCFGGSRSNAKKNKQDKNNQDGGNRSEEASSSRSSIGIDVEEFVAYKHQKKEIRMPMT